MKWEQSGIPPKLGGNRVHIWLMVRHGTAALDPSLVGLLSGEERERAGRFVLETDRDLFIEERAVLRKLLGHYLGREPGSIAIQYEKSGKPFCATRIGEDVVQFNIARSGDLVLLAFSAGMETGVDLEEVAPLSEQDQAVKRFFSNEEINEYAGLPGTEKLRAFYRSWTRKEAYLKARGGGPDIDIRSFSIVSRPGGLEIAPKAEIACAGGDCWSVYDIPMDDGTYCACAVVRGRAHRLSLYDWAWDSGL